MNIALIIAVLALIISLAVGLLAFGTFMALAHMAKLHEAFRNGVRGMAGAADEAFKSDRSRIFSIEKFLIRVFEMEEVMSKNPGDTDISSNVTKKDGGFKN
jgi:hypothetical protein